MKKRILSLLLTLAMVFTMMPMSAFAEDIPSQTTPATASIADVTITGTVGEELETQTATVTLTGDTFNMDISGEVSDWFTTLPAGITVTGTSVTSGAALTLTFAGTPDAAAFTDYELPYFVDTLALTIPGDVLVGGKEITVTSNENAIYMIEVTAPETPTTFAATQVNTYAGFKSAMAGGGDIQITGGFSYQSGQGNVTVTTDTVLDLNGYTVDLNYNNGNGFNITVSSGTLTIKDSSGGAGGKIHITASNAISIENTGKVILESGTIENTSTDTNNCGIQIKNANAAAATSLTVNGGTISSANTSRGIYILNQNMSATNTSATINISGGTVNGSLYVMSNYPFINLTVSGSPTLTNWTIPLKSVTSFKVSGTFTPANTMTLDGTGLTGISTYSFYPVITKTADATSSAVSGTNISNLTLTNITGKKLIANGDTSIVLAPTGGVAQVNGGTTYDTITAAIAAASANDTIKLLDNSLENITVDKNLTLDLNGKTLQTINTSPTINVTIGTLTIDTSAGTVTYYGTTPYTTPPTDGVVTLNGGSIEVKNGTVSGKTSNGINNLSTGNITVSGGTVSASDTNGAINNSGSGTITVSGGTVNGYTIAVNNTGTGAVDVTGGTVTASDRSGFAIKNTAGAIVTVSGGTVSNTGSYATYDNTAIGNTGTGTVKVTGGMVVSGNNTKGNGGINNTSTGTIIVDGGSISSINKGSGTLKNTAGTDVELNTFTVAVGTTALNSSTGIDSLTLIPAYTYGVSSVSTYSNTGNLYFWLPTDTTFTGATVTVPSSNATRYGTYKNESFTGKTATLAKFQTLSGIRVTTAPTKTTYTYGQTFAPAGMVVTADYSDAASAVIAAANYTLSPTSTTALTMSDTKITISYTEGGITKTVDQAITVNKATYNGSKTKTVNILNGAVRSGTVTLADILGAANVPDGAAFGTVTPPGTENIMSSVTKSGNDIAYTSKDNAAQTASSDAYTIAVSSTNYADFNVTITFQASDKTPETTPVAVIDYETEKLTGLTANAVYKIDGTDYTADSSGKIDISSLFGGTSVSINLVKKGNGTTTADSAAQTITLAARPATPGASVVTIAAGSNASNTKITLANTYEYYVGSSAPTNSTTWVTGSGTATDVSASSGQKVYIRVKATATAPASAYVDAGAVILGTNPPETTPTATIDYTAEKLTGLTANASYKIGGTSYTTDASGKISIDSTWFGTTISVVKAGNGSTTADSVAQTIVLAARPATPTASVVTIAAGSNASNTKITLVNTYEYYVGSSAPTSTTTWTTGNGTATDVSATSGQHVYVRLKATSTAPASAYVDGGAVVLGTTPPEPTPTATFDYTAEKLTGLTANASYKIGGASYTADANGKISIGSAWFGTTISVVKVGNGTTTADSAAQTIALAARPATPAVSVVTIADGSNASNTKITLSNTYEYYVGSSAPTSTTTWATGSGTATDVSASSGQHVYIRIKATSTAPASAYVDAGAVVLGSGSTGGGGNSGGGSSSGGNNNTPTTTPTTTPDFIKDVTDSKQEVKQDVKINIIVSSAGGSKTDSPVVSVTVKDTAVSVGIPQSVVTDAIKASTDLSKNNGDKTTVKFDLTASDNFKTMNAELPKAAMTELAKNVDNLVIQTQLGVINLDKKAMTTVANSATTAVTISTVAVDKTALPKETQTLVGDKPVYDFTITSGNKTISNFGNGRAVITLPYSLAKGEKANNIVIYYINDKGSLEVVKSCNYDEKTKTVSFATTHFSKYTVGVKTASYLDVPQDWYTSAVEYVTIRGLFNGYNGNFTPNGTMTRAMLVQVLANLEGVSPTTYIGSVYADVDRNAWYAGAVMWASSNKLIGGKDGLFKPDEAISREEMAVILYNYIKYKGIDLNVVNDKPFADINDVSAEAKTAVEFMKKYGLIEGVGNNTYAPKRTATRAEVAAIFTNVIKVLAK